METGPKYLDQLGKEADDSRTLVDILCRRVIRPDFESGKVPGRVSGPAELVDAYLPSTIVTAVEEQDRDDIRRACVEGFFMRFITDDEWDQVCQRLGAWQDELETASGSYDRSPLSKVCVFRSSSNKPQIVYVYTHLYYRYCSRRPSFQQ